MSAAVPTLVHPSCFPAPVAAQLRQSLHTRRIDPKLHYGTYAQARSWRKVHEQFAPSGREDSARHFYEQAYRALLPGLREHPFQLLGLGCGPGQKEARLLELAAPMAEPASYLPVDISLPLVIEGYLAAHPWAESIRPIICDLADTLDLSDVVTATSLHNCQRIVTLFGLLPQLEPLGLFASFRALLRPQDQVLFSVNLIPPGSPLQRLEPILTQYDNEPTRQWLLLFLHDLGIEETAGHLEWMIDEIIPDELYRLVAWFHFVQETQVEAAGETFSFLPPERLQLFYSYRYTPEGVTHLIAQLRKGRNGDAPLALENSWRSASGEEGLYHLRVQG